MTLEAENKAAEGDASSWSRAARIATVSVKLCKEPGSQMTLQSFFSLLLPVLDHAPSCPQSQFYHGILVLIVVPKSHTSLLYC